jgi:hypothetical protein
MYKLIDVRILPLEQIKANLNKNLYEMIVDEFFLNTEYEILIPVSNFIDIVQEACDYLKNDDDLEKHEVKLIKNQAKELIEQLKNLPSGVVIGAKLDN